MNMATKFLVTVLVIGVVWANVGARQLDEVSKELMDQKPVSIPTLPGVPALPGLPGVPQLPIPPMPSLQTIPGGEAAFATKGGRLEIGEVRVPKETKVGISNAKTATTNGLGAQLSTVIVSGDSFGQGTGNANAAASPSGPRADSTGTGTGSNSGYVIAEGPYASGNVDTGSNGAGGAGAAAGADGAIGVGSGNGGGYIYAGGYAGN